MDLKIALLDSEKQRIREFLKDFQLNYDEDIDYSLYLEENKEIIGTISTSQNIIKAFAVSPSYKGQVASLLISEAINNIYKNGFKYYQVYTSPKYKQIFLALNFYEIISSSKVSLLESRNRDIQNNLKKLKYDYKLVSKNTAAIVMNANPFTKGHRYLIEEAAKEHELLIVFILEAERSLFKYADRFKMVELGVQDLENVRVVPSSNYIISALTFPSYFLKEEDDSIYEQALLDALIFKKYFIPIFDLKKRYLGSEEDLVTSKYNLVLKEELGDFIEEKPRLSYSKGIISASKVRKYLTNKDYEMVKDLVPMTTFQYLKGIYGRDFKSSGS